MTTTDKIHVFIVHRTDLRIGRHIEEIHVIYIYIDHVHTLEIDNFHNTLCQIELFHNHENLDISDPDQVLRQKIKSKTLKQNNQNHLLTLISICTIPQKWLTL